MSNWVWPRLHNLVLELALPSASATVPQVPSGIYMSFPQGSLNITDFLDPDSMSDVCCRHLRVFPRIGISPSGGLQVVRLFSVGCLAQTFFKNLPV